MTNIDYFCEEDERFLSIEEIERLLTTKAFNNYYDYDYVILEYKDGCDIWYRVRYNDGMLIVELNEGDLNRFFENLGEDE